MEKIINIDGRDVPFKANGALPLRYKAQFGKDIFAEMARLDGIQDDFTKVDSEVFYQLIWAMAKCADPSIPPLIEWVESFNEFHVFSIFAEVNELLSVSIKPLKN